MPRAGERDYYEILGVERSAPPEAIKRAFRKLAMEYHPDRNADADATDRFKEIGRAYEILGDPERRAKYDQFGTEADFGPSTGFEGFDFGGFGDIFDTFFGGRRARRGPTRGGDLRVAVDLDFRAAVFGTEEEIRVSRLERCGICVGNGAEPGTGRTDCVQCGGSGEIRRAQRSIFGQFVNVVVCERCEGEGTIIANPCHNCGGVGREQRNRRLKVKVPAGVDDGSQMRLTGEGDAGAWGGPAGNLYVELRVKPHEWFTREGDDLFMDLPLNVAQAVLGAEAQIPTVDDEAVPLTIPAGTQHGAEFRLRRYGVPHLRGKGRGDLVVRANLRVPAKLTAEQRSLFEQLNATLASPMDGDGKDSLFSRLRDVFTA